MSAFSSNGGNDGWVEGLIKVAAVVGEDIHGLFGTHVPRPYNQNRRPFKTAGVHPVQAKTSDILTLRGSEHKSVQVNDILKGKIYPSGPNKFTARELSYWIELGSPSNSIPSAVPSNILDTAIVVAKGMAKGGASPPQQQQQRPQPPPAGGGGSGRGSGGGNGNGNGRKGGDRAKKTSNIQRNPVGPPSGADGADRFWGRSGGNREPLGTRSPTNVEVQKKPEASSEAAAKSGCNLPMRNSEDETNSSPVKKVDVSNAPASAVLSLVKSEVGEPNTVEPTHVETKAETAAPKETATAAEETSVKVETAANEAEAVPKTPTKLFGARVVVTSVSPTAGAVFDIGDGKTAEIGEQDVVEVGDQSLQPTKKLPFSEIAGLLNVGMELDADIDIHGCGQTPAKIVKIREDLTIPAPVPEMIGPTNDASVPDEAQEEKKEWRVGDTVRALYREDGVYYEAVVTEEALPTAEGDLYLKVQFVGYGNEEVVWVDGEVQAMDELKTNADRFADASEEEPDHAVSTAVVCNDLPVSEELELPPPQQQQATEEDVMLAGTQDVTGLEGPHPSMDVSRDEAFAPSASDTVGYDEAQALVEERKAQMSSIAACNQVLLTNYPSKTATADRTVPQGDSPPPKDIPELNLYPDSAATSKVDFAKAVEKASSSPSSGGKAALIPPPPAHLPPIAEEDVTTPTALTTDLLGTPNPIAVTDLLGCSISDLPSAAQCQIDCRKKEILMKLCRDMTAAAEGSLEVNNNQVLDWMDALIQLQRKM